MMKQITQILLFTFMSAVAMGQTLTYKEVKTIEKTIPYKSKDKLSISGERTYLTISTWNKEYISAKIDVISKYTDKTQASADLEKINVVLEKRGKTITYSNALRLKSPADKPKSHLSVNVSLRVPEGMKAEIINAFGEINLTGVFDKLETKSDFTAINIIDYQGKMSITTKYGDVSIDGYAGKLDINADRSNLIMENITGETNVDASYGELDIYYPKKSAFFNVNAAYSPISLYILEDYEEAIAITCKECSVVGRDDNIPLKISEGQDETNAIISKISDGKPTSLISSKLENINVKAYKQRSINN